MINKRNQLGIKNSVCHSSRKSLVILRAGRKIERIWINRRKVPIPKDYAFMAALLNTINGLGLGFPFLIYGLYNINFRTTLLGMVLIYAGKMWFLDRMVWLFENMKEKHQEYSNWEY